MNYFRRRYVRRWLRDLYCTTNLSWEEIVWAANQVNISEKELLEVRDDA